MSNTYSRQLMVPTDVATLVLFHPDDLAHTAGWEIAWYDDPFIFPVESAAGRLIAWITGSDGSYSVRVTNEDLMAREKTYATGSWTFPYTVRYGRVFLDNTDTLPGQEQMTQTTDNEDYWIDIPNGDYHVCVTGIEWEAEPGSDQDGFDKLPNYVVQFLPATPTPPAIAPRPPTIIGKMGEPAQVVTLPPTIKEDFPFDRTGWYPAFVCASAGWIGSVIKSQSEAPIKAVESDAQGAPDLYDIPFILASRMEVGAPALLASFQGASTTRNEATIYRFAVERLVKISAIDGMYRNGKRQKSPTSGWLSKKPAPLPADAIATAQVVPWAFGADDAVGIEFPALKEKIGQALLPGAPLAKHFGATANYERLRVGSFTQIGEFTAWLLTHLPLSRDDLMAILTSPPNKQSHLFMAALERL
jgi:hypothetical protein